MKLKYTFYLKSGKVFETYVDMTSEEFYTVTNVIKNSFKEGTDGVVTLDYCIVRLSECAVVEWEEIK